MRNLVAAVEVNAAGALVGSRLGIVGAPGKVGSVYTFTLEPDFDNLDVMAHATVTGALAGYGSPAAVVADNTIAVSTFDAAEVAADRGFHLLIFSKNPLFEGDGGRGRLHSSAQVALEPGIGDYFGKTLRVTGAAAVVAASIFDITLSKPIDPLDSAVVVGPLATVAPMGFYSVLSQTDTLLRVATFDDAGVAANRRFFVDVWRKGINGG